jgi:hypothetical protein
MRTVLGGLLAGAILRFVPGIHNVGSCLITGLLMTYLLLIMGPRSYAERLGALAGIAALAWAAGPSSFRETNIVWYFFGWFLSGTALAFFLRPRTQ